MAKWIIFLNSNATLTLLYKNIVDGAVFACGELRPDTPVEMIIDWVIHQPSAHTRDIIQLPNGVAYQLMPAPLAIQ